MSRVLPLAVVGLLVVTATVGVGTAALSGTTPAAREPADAFAQPSGFDSTTFQVEVYENGSARCTFNYFTGALNDSEQRQFREYADRFETEQLPVWENFKDRASVLVASGANTTERNMTARGFGREAGLNEVGNRGVVSMTFLWTDFAQVQDGRIVVADVFDGVFYIGPNQWLVFEAGPNLRFVETAVSPPPDEFSGTDLATSDTLTYFGEQQFPDNSPRVVLEPEPATATNRATTETTPAPDPASGGLGPAGMALSVLVLVVCLGAVAAWRSGMFGDGTTADPPTDDGPDGGGVAATEGDAGGADAAAASSSDADDATGGTDAAVTDEQLLTDEDRVLTLLEDNGGRMKQANIVDETGWSKSKVSMLLSDMADEDQISKLRVGRENIISLRGHEPDAAGSPFDDE